MAESSALEMVAAAEPGAASVARLITALGAHDDGAIANVIATLKELSVTALLSSMKSNAALAAAINASILQDASPMLTKWLFHLVSDGDDALAEYVLQYIPAIAWAFIRRLNSSEPSLSAGVLLQAICERRFPHGTIDERFQLESPTPDLSIGSIYHKPMEGQKLQAPLTANQLRDHDLRSGVAATPAAADDSIDTSTIGGLKLARSALARFCVWMPKLPPMATTNFCILSIRLCSDDAALYKPFTELEWDAANGSQTFFPQAFSMLELEQLLVRGLVQAFVTPGCRPVAMAAVTALHNKAQLDIEPAILLSTASLMERMRFDI